jgi:hypothetical protein
VSDTPPQNIVVSLFVITSERRVVQPGWRLRIWDPYFPWQDERISMFITYGRFVPETDGGAMLIFERGPQL